MIYLGGTTFLTMFFSKVGIVDIEFALQAWLISLGVIQLICDVSYKKEPLTNLPAEKTDKIKS